MRRECPPDARFRWVDGEVEPLGDDLGAEVDEDGAEEEDLGEEDAEDVQLTLEVAEKKGDPWSKERDREQGRDR